MGRPMEAMTILARCDAVAGAIRAVGAWVEGKGRLSVHIHFDSTCVLVGRMERADLWLFVGLRKIAAVALIHDEIYYGV